MPPLDNAPPLPPVPAFGFDPAGVPETLRSVPRWVLWKYAFANERWTKVPLQASSGFAASTTVAASWCSFEDADAGLSRHPGCAGLGFVFSDDDDLVGIDLDDCVNEKGAISDGAKQILSLCPSYAEFSPSGTGIKIFVRGQKPPGAGCRSAKWPDIGQVEVYERGRFFVVTGHPVPGNTSDISHCQTGLDSLCGTLWPDPPTTHPPPPSGGFTGDDTELLDRIRGSRQGLKFERLWAGDMSGYADNHSSADQALCCILAFWTGNDPARIDRLFRQSRLHRAKWDRQDYRDRTIRKAIERCGEFYSPQRRAPSGDAVSSDRDTSAARWALGTYDPETGKLILSRQRTLPTAQSFVREHFAHPIHPMLLAHGGIFYRWEGNCYRDVEDASLRHQLQRWLHNAFQAHYNANTKAFELRPFDSNPATVNAALESTRDFVFLPASTPNPSWLVPDHDSIHPKDLIVGRTRSYHIPTGRVIPATPALFTTSALDFDFDPNPEPCESWCKFLEQLFGDDLESARLLQQWFGYSLVADTSQQKMLLVIGPRRSGKGTIGRVLTTLIGPRNIAGPTTASLAGTFGLQPLLGKSLAIVSDARFRGEGTSAVIERLLCISGEDPVTVDIKHRDSLTLKLPVRFMFLTNEMPKLNDAATAIAGRFVILKLDRSFYGHEDTGLTERLQAERAGILSWAIEGLRDLRRCGRFVTPASTADLVRDIEELGSPVLAFVRECCVVGPGYRVEIDVLYARWKAWCETEGRNLPTTKPTFGRDLQGAVLGVGRRRGTDDVSFYQGIRLKEHYP